MARTKTLTLTLAAPAAASQKHTPYTSSLLSIPPSPTAPASPILPATPTLHLTGQAYTPTSSTTTRPSSITTIAPPTQPLPWHWQCHLCHRTYSLSVTRRCLDDGHLFCSGEPLSSPLSPRRGNRTGKGRARARSCKRGKACASEFDYAGWKAWGEWRRIELAARAHNALISASVSSSQRSRGHSVAASLDEEVRIELASPSLYMGAGTKTRNCEGKCDYPSECRWGPLSVQRSPVTPLTPNIMTPSALVGAGVTSTPTVAEMAGARGSAPATSFDDILAVLTADDRLETSTRTPMSEPGERREDVQMSDAPSREALQEAREEKDRVNPLSYVRSYGENMGLNIVEMPVQGQAHKGYLPAWLRA